jgi:lipoprotein-releasing system permease protein
MYKLLLCWRYLLTRYLALVCIVSVMLGVATLIVVNSVMAGFSTKLRDRLHGMLSDVVIESVEMEGFPDPEGQMRRIRESAVGQSVQAMTPTIEVFALMQFTVPRPVGDSTVTKKVQLVGVDPQGRTEVGSFKEFLKDQRGNPIPPSFEPGAEALARYRMRQMPPPPPPPPVANFDPDAPPPPEDWARTPKTICGAIIGHALGTFRDKKHLPDGTVVNEDRFFLLPGDEITLTTVSGAKMLPVIDRFLVVGYSKSEMSEYDSSHVFVPLDYLQHLRTMQDRATSIQIKLKNYGDAKTVVDTLRKMFPNHTYMVNTWEEKQGPLLEAIVVERGILNVLLFMIVGVAGFGILAIFSMIVVEKTRDIGILKALGASNRGVMSIFLSYGLLLGTVGAVIGTGLGLTITTYLNEIEQFLTRITGHEVFDRTIYYFDKIPTYIQPSAVMMVNIGAIGIAVVFSILPALRAAMLHPVKALRYE